MGLEDGGSLDALVQYSRERHYTGQSVLRFTSQLALHGIDALGETASTAVDPALLMRTMEIRCVGCVPLSLQPRWLIGLICRIDSEEIDDAPTVEALDQIRTAISEQIDAIIQKLGEVYDRKHDLDATKRFAVELQYMVKCAEEIELREEKLDANA